MAKQTWFRVFAEQQPRQQQAVFKQWYPNGLPRTYIMCPERDQSVVPQTYVENNLPVGFYINPPTTAEAIFSTRNGKDQFKRMHHVLPHRHLHLWPRDEIQAVCNSVRKVHWASMKRMQRPESWDDLWKYFDAHDLYYAGAINLWNVLNTLIDENEIIFKDLRIETAVIIGHWLDAWLAEDNQSKLIAWTEGQGPILDILSDRDRASIGDIEDEVVPLLENALFYRRDLLLGSPQPMPSDLVTACSTNSLQNWLDKPTLSPGGLPSSDSSVSPPPPRELWIEPPCVQLNGLHYYGSKSLSAYDTSDRYVAGTDTNTATGRKPSRGPVIAHGSSVSPFKAFSQGYQSSRTSSFGAYNERTYKPLDGPCSYAKRNH
ncbi:unnamed protein product [Clonostachys byssicola]|uniref:Uncharacterized protein n=1 Tax=Clonostachys byssicola TaxID=160290 RepID=A0A9N9Y3X9_9HYPO|nr:unnamed protein product [Clonostachys byssicola]